MTILTDAELAALGALDTPTVANVIETYGLRLRNEGYMDGSVPCRLPKLQPMVGYAVTMQMRADKPPVKGRSYPDRNDWWDTLLSQHGPKVLVIQDTDPRPGAGSLAGGAHGSVFRALGCIGIVTNGAVRDLPALEALRLHVYSGVAVPSHAYAHAIDVGMPVVVGGMTVRQGDLLHGDLHGIVVVPHGIAREIPGAALKVMDHEREIQRFCASEGCSVERLRRLIQTF